jgi:hypothetical protein
VTQRSTSVTRVTSELDRRKAVWLVTAKRPRKHRARPLRRGVRPRSERGGLRFAELGARWKTPRFNTFRTYKDAGD